MPSTPARPSFLALSMGIIIVVLAVVTGVAWIRMRREPLPANPVSPARPSPELEQALRERKALVERLQEMESRLQTLEARLRERRNPGPTHTPPIRVDRREGGPERPRAADSPPTRQADAAFRRGEYLRAENLYFRAVYLDPTDRLAHVGLALTALVRSDYADAWGFLRRLLASGGLFWDGAPSPLRAFRTREEYVKVRGALERHLRTRPLDAEAKLLLAYLYYHEKGSNHAKALAAELPADHPDAKALIAEIDAAGK